MAACSSSSGELESELEGLQVAVEELYSFRDTFFQHRPLEAAGEKAALLDAKLQEVLRVVRDREGGAPRASLLYLEGKALNVLSEPSAHAEEVLSQAVKLSPGLADAWNQLGECYWKQGRVVEAKDCFLGALQHCHDKVSLRSLSMVVRHVDKPGTAEQMENTKQSVKYAEQAVQLDVKDGQSWAALGNAYMSLFFLGGQDADSLQRARSAFTNAEKDRKTYYTPDLHYNKATLCKYLEEYGAALAGYRLSATLDPGWGTPGEQADTLAQHLLLFHQLIQEKGKAKRKQMTSYLSKLARHSSTEEACDLASLHGRDSSGRSVLLVIVGQLATQERVPLCLVAVDRREEPVGVTLYNLADGRGPLTGDVLQVADPRLRQVRLEDPKVAFDCITVRNPITIAVNGKPLPRSCMAPTVMNVTSLQ